MRYIDSKKLFETDFKRYKGISCFIGLITENAVSTKGKPSKLSTEDQVLLCLSYWCEYRILFHVATSYGVSEPTVSRIVRQVRGLPNQVQSI